MPVITKETRVRHVKRGSTYTVLGHAHVRSVGNIRDMQAVVVGTDEQGWWSIYAEGTMAIPKAWLVGVGKAQVQGSLIEGDSVVVYRSDADQSLWVRPEHEFDDGRFEIL